MTNSVEATGDAIVTKSSKKHGPWVPFENPLTSLPETAQKILEAASRLLRERGYPAVTLENVAAEAGVNKASIRYNFGNKAGLVAAVVDALIHDECLRMVADAHNVTDEDRLHTAMVGIQGMIVSADAFRGFFDILPHAFRDDDLRERMFDLYEWWYKQNLEWLGLTAEGTEGEAHELLMGLAELIAAIPDGLSVQIGLNPEHFDLSRPLAALEFLLRNSMGQLAALSGPHRDSAG